MTDIEALIARLEGLMAKATPGDWTAAIWRHPYRSDTVCVKNDADEEIISWPGFDGVRCTKAEIRANCTLVAEAKSALPALIAHIRALSGAVEAANK